MIPIPEDSKCIVETKDGPICGYIEKTDEGVYYKFKSIPYAKPPVGSLRFLPPSPVQPWYEILDCTQEAPICLFRCEEKTIIGSEDCLYIEVSSPNMNPDRPLPVMFWIGGYGYGCSMDNILDPSLINNHNVVFVRCGYRSGPFGFLSINDYTAPGNCGLKDIVKALKWVQNNIYSFGGDPKNVTLFGSSSGGAIVHFMMLSPMATGLFHKAIIQSLSALNNWSLAKNPTNSVMTLARELGINKTSPAEIIDVLRTVPADDIIKTFTKLKIEGKTNNAPHSDHIDAIFKPSIEVDLEGLPAFITKSPVLILKSGNFNKVPLIIGSNNIEASVLEYLVKDFYSDFEKYNENVRLLVPREMAREDKSSENIGHQLLKFYLGGREHLTADTKTEYLQLISDYYFSYYVNKTVRLHSEYAPESPIYYYIMDFQGDWKVPELYRFFNSRGHCAELPYIFRLKMPEECAGSRDCVTIRSRVVKMWTNFAKTGNPTPDDQDPLLQITWDPVENKDKLNYLNIGLNLTKGRNPYHERMQFWDSLHKEHAFLRALVYFNDIGCTA